MVTVTHQKSQVRSEREEGPSAVRQPGSRQKDDMAWIGVVGSHLGSNEDLLVLFTVPWSKAEALPSPPIEPRGSRNHAVEHCYCTAERTWLHYHRSSRHQGRNHTRTRQTWH